MTEVSHGSNLRGIETTVFYDKDSQEFVVNTPTWRAAKWAIALAAWNACIATVLGRLILPGGEDKGVHAFLVPLRNAKGNLLTGVTAVDCGQLIGLNGVGIGGLAFRNVRIPRENLLNRFCDVEADGTFVTKAESPGDLFRMTVGPLMVERLVPFASVACKFALAVAVRFSRERKQFGPPGGDEIPIMSYVSHQRRLMPVLAKTYAISIMLEKMHAQLDHLLPTGLPRDFQALCSSYKAISYEYATETVRTSRECCNVHSFRHVNKIGRYMEDLNGFAHAAGDNIVLLQYAARILLESPNETEEIGSISEGSKILDLEWQQAALQRRYGVLRDISREEIAKNVSSKGLFEAWNEGLPFSIKMARAYSEAKIHQCLWVFSLASG